MRVAKRMGADGSSTPCSCAKTDMADLPASLKVNTLKKKYVGPEDGSTTVALKVEFEYDRFTIAAPFENVLSPKDC